MHIIELFQCLSFLHFEGHDYNSTLSYTNLGIM